MNTMVHLVHTIIQRSHTMEHWDWFRQGKQTWFLFQCIIHFMIRKTSTLITQIHFERINWWSFVHTIQPLVSSILTSCKCSPSWTWIYGEHRVPTSSKYRVITRDNITVITLDEDNTQYFPIPRWATIAGFLTFVLLLNLGYKLLGVSSKYKSPAWMVTCAFLFEDNFPDDTPFNKMITFTACIFLFFFGGYLLNSMQSDLVVYDSPEVIASYQDIFDRITQGRKLQILFYSGLPEVEQFREAPSDSLLGRLWKLRVEMFDESVDTMQWFFKLMEPVVQQTGVTILREVLVRAITAWVLVKVTDVDVFKPMRALLSIDRDPLIKYTNVMVFNKKLDPISKGQIILMLDFFSFSLFLLLPLFLLL